MKTFANVIAVITALSATAVSAGTVDVIAQNPNNVFKDDQGQNAWYVATKFSVGNYNSNLVAAGAFRLSDDNGALNDFLAFCLQPMENFIIPTDYAVGSLFSNAVTENLQILAENAMDLVTNRKSAAAFQMAAWEITTETASTYDIVDGYFAITSNRKGSNKAEALAQTWLSNIDNGTWVGPQKDYLILNADGTQDLLTNIQPMPLPASSLLLLGGLAGAGAVVRRKQKAK